MNKSRRSQLRKLDDSLAVVLSELEKVLEAETEAFENMPENLQSSERGESMEAANDYLGEALDLLNDARVSIANVIGY